MMHTLLKKIASEHSVVNNMFFTPNVSDTTHKRNKFSRSSADKVNIPSAGSPCLMELVFHYNRGTD